MPSEAKTSAPLLLAGMLVRVQAKPCSKETLRSSDFKKTGIYSSLSNSPEVTLPNSMGLLRQSRGRYPHLHGQS